MQHSRLFWIKRALFAFILAPALGGCSFLWPMFESDRSEIPTGSIAKPAEPLEANHPIFKNLSEEDMRRAKGAMGIALDPGGNGKAVRWENSETKTSGAFEPKDLAYASPRGVCRLFAAQVKRDTESKDFTGTACKDDFGQWNVIAQ